MKRTDVQKGKLVRRTVITKDGDTESADDYVASDAIDKDDEDFAPTQDMTQKIATRAATIEINQERMEQPQQQNTGGKLNQALLSCIPVVPTNKQINIEKKTKDAERKQQERNAAKNRREQL